MVPVLAMSDVFTPRKRSEIMRAVRSTDTKPEMAVRRLLHRMGYRYCLHVRSLPGTPDLVFPSRHKVILVHGCYWHRHLCREGRSMPSSRTAYWRAKFARNRLRDSRTRRALLRSGWRILVLWECQLHPKKLPALMARLRRFLDG